MNLKNQKKPQAEGSTRLSRVPQMTHLRSLQPYKENITSMPILHENTLGFDFAQSLR